MDLRICGFANAYGGRIILGVDDNPPHEVVGLADADKLMEDLPNKVRDVLGVMVDVNLHHVGDTKYIEMVVEPYPYPVNYKGQYHYRSGSTKQELKGAALSKFLLAKVGVRWASQPVVNMNNVVPYIKQYRDVVLSSDQMGFFRRRLLEVISTSESDRKEHLGNVYRNKERRDSAVASGRCPRCGGNLVLRNGKYGQFYGCSNYPRCNYILNK